MRPYWYEERKCPVCGNTFQIKIVRSGYGYKVLAVDLDLFPHVDGEHPVIYEADMCPKCGYANYRSEFDKVKIKDKAELIKFLVRVPSADKEVASKPDRTPEDALVIYKWVYNFLEYSEAPKHKLALTLHRIAWLYRIIGDDEEEKEYLSKALKLYEEALANTKERYASREMFIKVIYYAAVVSYLLGFFDKSVKYLNDLLKLEQSGYKLTPVMRKHIFDLWQDLRAKVGAMADIDMEKEQQEDISMDVLLSAVRNAYRTLEGKLSVREMNIPSDKKSMYTPLKRLHLAMSHLSFLEYFKKIDASSWESFLRLFHKVMEFFSRTGARYEGDASGYELLFDGKSSGACIIISTIGMIDSYLEKCGKHVKNIMVVGIIETEEDETLASDIGLEVIDEGMWFYEGRLYQCLLFKK